MSQLSGETTRLCLHQNGRELEAHHLMDEADRFRNVGLLSTNIQGDASSALHQGIGVDSLGGVRPGDDPLVEDVTGVAKNGTVRIGNEVGQGHPGGIMHCIHRLVDDLAHTAVMS